MSQSTQTNDSQLSSEEVLNFLTENGDFLQRHPELMDHLVFDHDAGNSISLVEKQVSVLRERNVDMRHRLSSLTANARSNDEIYSHTRKLVLALIEAETLDALSKTFMLSMQKDFGVEYASLIFFGESQRQGHYREEAMETANIEIGHLLKSRKNICGVLRKNELKYLFESDLDVGSAAVIPLRRHQDFGIIAIGSNDPNYYHSSVGTLFLAHIADVIVRLIPSLDRA